MATNKIGRDIPDAILASSERTTFEGAGMHIPQLSAKRQSKVVDTLGQALSRSALQDGMTISFHHAFRNGDYVLNMVLDAIAAAGIKNLTLAPSSLTDAHAPLSEHIGNGVIRKIFTSGMRGKLGEAISSGILSEPVIFHSHGGRARALESGSLQIDVAFLGVSSCDEYGNANGCDGPSACGALGYAICDARHAAQVVLITDQLVDYPNIPCSISQDRVDTIVLVDSIGDPAKISSGATRISKNPRDLLLAEHAAHVIIHSGYFRNGFSFQTGSGGASLATTRFLRKEMLRRDIKMSFALGGITSAIVQLYEEGLIQRLFDVQSLDAEAIRSLREHPFHCETDVSCYANPLNKGCVVHKLDVVVLSALEVDVNFHVNVITGADGVIRGATGGHPDAAAGSELAVIICPLVRGRIASVMRRVQTVVTPGECVDVVVTEYGIAVNPRRPELKKTLEQCRLPLVSIEELRRKAESITGVAAPLEFTERIVGLIEYRDGTLLDVVRQIAD
ncbi:citrate lyase subunit alpha [candidate division KSB3 bacterium]|uniref:Citrate lyase alpha chain n=1 Tax=candidate division KSB3 bacterium TaxID=2044937 RepID=A0A2G6E5J4_9BACT|nr:MAG: citrate lyase subunit alpha [candidate division KSB3 bacterium]PIE29635.1 MAG: citrate lyase subunit alpha [candidate division KSB3 bacterium]